jgi:hypothetical protein
MRLRQRPFEKATIDRMLNEKAALKSGLLVRAGLELVQTAEKLALFQSQT